MLKKIFVLILFSATLIPQMQGEGKKKHTVMSCVVNNFKKDMIYLDCPQTPMIKGEFHRNPGEEHLLIFDTDKLITLRVNGQELEFLLEPGDSLHADITYGDRLAETIIFSGTERAVRQNQMLWQLYRHRLSTRFKTSLNACLVLDHKPTDRIAAANRYATEAEKMMETNQSQYSKDFKNYVKASIEALTGESKIYYPDLYAMMRQKPIKEQGIGNYWTIMDNYQTRKDQASLRCPQYVDFLIKYMVYEKAKKEETPDKQEGLERYIPQTLEGSYKLAVETFQGDQLDAVLFRILTGYIVQGKNLDEAEKWIADYKQKYNKDKEYAEILDFLMQ